MQKNIEVAVKNMVCNRCIKVVKDILDSANIKFSHIDLGTIYLREALSNSDQNKLIVLLEKEGFQLLEKREAQIVNRIKSLLIATIHQKKDSVKGKKYSDWLPTDLGIGYTQLSKLFSTIEGRSIEKYIIIQKIERTKELLIYNELSLSEISYELQYSSPQHLSKQFKQITGLTPSEFKKNGSRRKIDLL